MRISNWDSLGATLISSEGFPLLPPQRLCKTLNLILAGMVRSTSECLWFGVFTFGLVFSLVSL